MTKIQEQTQALAQSGSKTMQQYIKSMESEIKKALPSVITPERFTRMVLTALSVNPKLAQCTPKSFLGAMMNAAQLGLEPNTPLGQAYLIPFKNHGVDEVQFQIGYKGLIDLAYRSGEVSIIQAQIVYENDRFECQFGLEPKLLHIPADDEHGEPKKVYAVYKTKNGGSGFEVMSMADIRAHAERYSQALHSGKPSPWNTNFEEMAKKTVLKHALKYAPLHTDFIRAVAQDETIKVELSEDMYSVSDTTVFETAEYTDQTGAASQTDQPEAGGVSHAELK